MLAYLLSYLSGLLTLLILDGLMIWFVILPLFKRFIPNLLNTAMNIPAAILFYLLYIGVILFLIVQPAIKADCDICTLMRNAALFGFGAYMTYELTSMSVIKGWNWQMVILDTLWGTLLTLIIALVMWQTYKFFM